MLSEGWKDTFVEMLIETGNVSASARIANVSRQHAYLCRQTDPEFAARWDDAIEEGTDNLEEIAMRRAKEGSDTLTIFLLKARRPDKYRENIGVKHEGGVTVRVEYVDHDHDYLANADDHDKATSTASSPETDSQGSEEV